MIMRRVLIYIFLLIIYGCIEPFEVDFDLDTSNIVISGIITDLEPAQVEITKPVLRNKKLSNVERVSGATVILLDDQGNKEQLYEQREGFYKGSSKGIVGRTYHIKVHLSDNDIIVSAPQLLNPSSSIDGLWLEQRRFFKVFGKIKKHVFYNKEMNLEGLIEELGDLEFYLEGLRQGLGVTREEILEGNIAKLTKRYSEGSYSDKAANERADKNETV